MNRPQQILHILKKDIRQRWPEIICVLALIILLTIASIDNPAQPGRLSEFLRYTELAGPILVLLPVAWCVLIARAILGESLPGREQLWLTRPYDRLSLVLAKLALILLFVHLPLIVAHIVILWLSELVYSFVAMVIGHLVLFAVLTLPAMAVASLTRSLGQFIGVAVGIVVGLVAVLFTRFELLRDVLGLSMDPRQGWGWMAMALIYLFVGVCTAIACAWQYRTRRTRAVTVALASVAAIAVLMVLIDVPRNLARALELNLYGDDSAASLVAFGPPQVVQSSSAGALIVQFPQIRASGGLVLRDWHLRLTSASGVELEQHSAGYGNLIEIYLTPDFVARFGDSPLRAEIDYVVGTFDEIGRQQIQITHDRQEAAYSNASLFDGRLQCWFTAFDWAPIGEGMGQSPPRIDCRSAFASPGDWHFELLRTADGLTGMVTHDRTELPIALNPIFERRFAYWIEAEGVVDDELYDIVTLPMVVRQRATLEQGQLQFDDIVLSELSASD